jgi:hypothetical protein
MSIKLSIKDLKDLLKINKQLIKKKKQKRKRSSKTKNDINYNKSSSDHMKSTGFTNTSNEATELIRLQRQALEAKLKADKEKAIEDKENKIKNDNNQLIADKEGGLVSYNPLKNNGGNNSLRFKDIDDSINHIYMNFNQYRPPQLGDTVNMVTHGQVKNPQTNTDFTPASVEELKDDNVFSEKVPHILDNNNAKAEEKAEVPFIKNIDPNEKFYTKVIYNYTKEQLIAYINHWDGTLRSELNLLTVAQLKTHARSMQDHLGVKMTNKIDDVKQSAKNLKEAEASVKSYDMQQKKLNRQSIAASAAAVANEKQKAKAIAEKKAADEAELKAKAKTEKRAAVIEAKTKAAAIEAKRIADEVEKKAIAKAMRAQKQPSKK